MYSFISNHEFVMLSSAVAHNTCPNALARSLVLVTDVRDSVLNKFVEFLQKIWGDFHDV